MRCLLLLSLLIAGVLVAAAQEEDTVKLLNPRAELEEVVSMALKGCEPPKTPPNAAVNKNGVYVLDGDLFHDGHSYAVIDHDPLLIAEWRDGQWKLKAALNLAPVWKYPGWDASNAKTRKPDATRPFWAICLEHQPVLAVASDVEKAGQDYQVILFDAGLKSILDTDFSLRTPPSLEDGYLLTSDGSRGKAEWGEDYFSRIENHKFAVVKSWTENTPYVQPEPPDYDGDVYCFGAQSGSKAYTITPDYSKQGNPEDYLVFKGKLRLDGWRGIFEAWKNNKIFARVSFVPKSKAPTGSADMPEAETAYLFEKLTGLPRKLYRIPEGIELKEDVESLATVKVRGDPEAIEVLSPTQRKASVK